MRVAPALSDASASHTQNTHSAAEANAAVQTWQPSSVEGNNCGI